MKKRWIPFILIAIVAIFLTGLRIGSTSTTTTDTPHTTPPPGHTANYSTTIAVVNADAGTVIDGTRYNYSAAIISSLGPDFVLVSPAMAQTGFANGIYSAIITFPQ